MTGRISETNSDTNALSAHCEQGKELSVKKIVYIINVSLLVIVLVFTGINSFGADKGLSTEVGRYQLFQGEYQFINSKGEGYWSKGLFKIDTATGKVWIARSIQSKDSVGQVIQKTGWTLFEEEVRFKLPK